MTPLSSAPHAQERILQAATDLFARLGFNGASTRDIARLAAVNDATVYRHFTSKKDLFVTVLEAELQKPRMRPDLLREVANAKDACAAIANIFELLTNVFADQPKLLRLLHFAVLEFGCSLQPLYQRHMGALLEETATYLDAWRQRGDLRCGDSRATLIAFAVTAIGMQTLHPILAGEHLSPNPDRIDAGGCTALWHSVLHVTEAR